MDDQHAEKGPDDEGQREDRSEDQSEGQVSEVSLMDPDQAETPIQPDQSVAGSPDDESGSTDEGPQGPNANPNAGAGRT